MGVPSGWGTLTHPLRSNKGHLLQEACVGTGDTGAEKISRMLALCSVLDPGHSSVSDSDCGLGLQSFCC